jgi:photosystem II oxygen-evolving enhancer protein 2
MVNGDDRCLGQTHPSADCKEIRKMLKRIAAIILVVLTISLTGCISSPTTGLKPYVNSYKGYEFLYPNGWVEVPVKNGPDVVFKDLIESSENVSVVISAIPENQKLQDIGDPSTVGYKILQKAIAPEGSGREAELINATAIEKKDKTYYILEYAVKLANQERHDIASVAISRGKLFSFNVSTTANRWRKTAETLKQVVTSFSVY